MPKQRDRHRHAPSRQGATPSTPTPATSAERLAALMGLVPRVAAALRQGGERAALASARLPMSGLPPAGQLAGGRPLGAHRGAGAVDDADVALALAELASDRSVAKEARRASIRLRSAGARATITIPKPASAAPVAPASAAPVLAGAWASRTRERSEVVLLMIWSRPNDPQRFDPFALTLNYWEGQIQEAIRHDPVTRRHFDREMLPNFFSDVRADYDGAEMMPISAGQTRALIEEALDMQAWRQTPPDDTWLEISDAVLRRVQRDDIKPDPSAGLALLDPATDADEMLVNFWGSWAFGDFELAYDLLGERHALRERQTRDEFVALRRQWYDEAHPARFLLSAIAPQTQEQSGLWLPGSGTTASASRQTFQLFWSLEIDETPIAGQLEEIPFATMVNGESRRHWFWQSVTVERDPQYQLWRLGRIRDEGLAAQSRPVEELVKRSDELWAEANGLAEKNPQPQSDQVTALFQQMMALANQAISLGESALMRLPLDRALYDKMHDYSSVLGFWERAAALTQRMLPRFPDRVMLLKDLCALDYRQSRTLDTTGDREGARQWLERAAANAERLNQEQPSAESRTMLGEILLSLDRADEAEALLREAIALEPTVGAWMDLGELLMTRDQGVEAIEAFESAQRLEPGNQQIRWRLGRALEMVGRPAEAKLVYEDALAQDENDAMAHALLGGLLFERETYDEAEKHLRRARDLGLNSAETSVQLANIQARRGNFKQARQLLNEAAESNPAIADQIKSIIARLNAEEAIYNKRNR